MGYTKIEQTIWNMASIVAKAWFRDQVRNLHASYYLYTRTWTPADGNVPAAMPIHSEDNPDASRYELASCDRMSPAMSESEMTAWIVKSIRRSPILNPNYNF